MRSAESRDLMPQRICTFTARTAQWGEEFGLFWADCLFALRPDIGIQGV